MSDWEALADQAQEEAYRVVERPRRSHMQKMRDLINEIARNKELHRLEEEAKMKELAEYFGLKGEKKCVT